jgi:hypothetical protein
MAFHFLLVGPAQADRPHCAAARRERKTVGLSVDQAPGPVALFAIVEPIVQEDGQHLEVYGTTKGDVMLCEIRALLVWVELDLHFLYIQFGQRDFNPNLR